jgi:hypothetical protein
MHQPVLLVDDADVVDRDAGVLEPPISVVNVPADHQLRSAAIDGRQQLADAKVLDLPRAHITVAVPVTVRRLMRN